jgi:hypothetical protein
MSNGTTIDPSQSTLSPNFAPFVYDMLGKAQTAADLPYQPYTGQRFAFETPTGAPGYAPLEQQYFNTVSGLQPPSMAGATQLATGATSGLGTYTPGAFTSQFAAPGVFNPMQFSSGYTDPTLSSATQFTNQFQGPAAYQTGQFQTGYQAPTAYQAAQFTPGFNYQAGQISTGLGPIGSVQDYMNPYLSSVMDVQAREARREADTARQAEQARLAQAGAYGGSRQAIMEAERQRNLNTQIGDIRAQGLQAAFDQAQRQRLAESQLGLTAQEATERARQFGAERAAQFGLEAQRGTEASRQFGAGQSARSAEFASQQAMEAQRAQELSRQFGAGQAMTAAQERARYGMDALTSAEAARQFQEQQRVGRAKTAAEMQLEQQRLSDASRQYGYGKGLESAEMAARYGMDALRTGEESRQFGAKYGLDAAARQLDAARTLGDLEASKFGLGLKAAQEQAAAGREQRAIAQSPLDFGYEEWRRSVDQPYKSAQFMQQFLPGLPLEATRYQPEQSALVAALQGLLGARALTGG